MKKEKKSEHSKRGRRHHSFYARCILWAQTEYLFGIGNVRCLIECNQMKM